MAVRLDSSIRDVLMDAIDQLFDNGTLLIQSGSQPADADTALAGTTLATISLPADAFGAVSSAAIAKAGTWQDTSADATGTAGHFRLRDSGDTNRIDGSITATAGGGDMELDSTSIVAAGTVTISTFTITMPAE